MTNVFASRLASLYRTQTGPDWLEDLPEDIAEELSGWKVTQHLPETKRRGDYPTCLTEITSPEGYRVFVLHVDPAIERLYVGGIASVCHQLEFFRVGRKR